MPSPEEVGVPCDSVETDDSEKTARTAKRDSSSIQATAAQPTKSSCLNQDASSAH